VVGWSSVGVDELRGELRAWLAAHPAPAADDVAALREWQRALYEQGWVGIHWPVEFGGQGASVTQVAVYNEELGRAGAPPLLGRAGITLVGPTLIAHGTDAQRSRWMSRILCGDDVWCQLFSEPGAGSDLVALATRATKSGGVYRVTGQKVWSSYATAANMGIALVRTDPDAPSHKGISMLAVPMDAAGVEVRPLRQMTGEFEFNEVFLDDVEVPVDNLIGPENDGWRVANTTLANERGASFIWREQVLQRAAIDALIDECARRGVTDDARVRQRLTQSWIDVELFRLHNEMGAAPSVVKLWWAAVSQRLAETAVAVLGPDALLTPSRWAHALLATRANSIMGGTSEIQKNLIGERLLGLPREPK
jgi:alkylation response protein AidB-like acyl-CoA dehydrogenase